MKTNSLAPSEDPTNAPQSGHPTPHRRILVVDDEPELRQISTEVLTHSGYQVDAMEDGDVAWEALQQNRYDLLVTDNRMTRVSGVELLKKIHAAGLGLPVIMATGAWPKAEFTREPWLQPAVTLLKPYTNAELVEAVQKVLVATNGVARSGHVPAASALGVSTP